MYSRHVKSADAVLQQQQNTLCLPYRIDSTLPVSVKGYQSTVDGGLLSSPQSLNYMSMKWWTWMLLRLLLAAAAAGMAVAVTFFHPVFLSVYFKTRKTYFFHK